MRRSVMAPPPRRGVILLVVMSLLTLFSVLGLAFVLYAQSQARASRLFRDASNLDRPDVDRELLLAYFLGQLVYDADDTIDAFSALRGHGLARNMYGWNRDDPGGNQVPFNGTGRLHTNPQTSLNPWQLDDFYLINYTVHPADNFRRDPERWRDLHTGGANPPYTYPDLNHLFLAAMRADGTVLLPSFHRPWTDRAHPNRYFGSLDPANPNWHDQGRPWLKYLVMRPRPAEHPAKGGRPGFPAPEDAGGDVKNLVGSPGGNDSIWIDLDFPVMNAPDGRPFKPLFAPLVVDLDNGNPRVRRRVLHSFDVDRPGVFPWLFDRNNSAYQPPLADPEAPPVGPAVPFPSLALRSSAPVPRHSEFRIPGAGPASPLADWRSQDAALGRVDLNRFLPPYPHQGQGLTPTAGTPLVGPADRFDASNRAWEQHLAAQTARQRLAADVYLRLLAVTGVDAPADRAQPTDAELQPRRWLAQLAANIVDFIDKDEISTPLQFYTAQDAGTQAFDAGAVNADNLELPRYWVFGTELPRVVLNEVLTEYQVPARNRAGAFAVRAWVELFNPLPAGPLPDGTQPPPAQPVPFHVGPAGGKPGYSPYRVLLANSNANAGGPLLPRPGNDNVLGAPDIVRAATEDADFAGVAGPAPQGFFLLGPLGTDARNTLAPPRLPAVTPWLRSPNLEFRVGFSPPNTWFPDERPGGLTVVLRRLANPHLPYDPRPAVGGAANPAYNPYLTIDYLQSIPLNDATSPSAIYATRGKLQPYAADPGQVAPAAPVPGSGTWHTLGRPNVPAPPGGHYDWLVHLDRPLVSPAELLHVSGHHPHRLTQRFVSTNALGGAATPYNHRVPWYDESNRLYRVLEFLSAHKPGTGTAAGGRLPGKVNLNTVWDPETLRALCDPQPSASFTPADVDAVYARMVSLRTPGGRPGPADRPFLSLAVGRSPRPGDAQYPAGGDPLFPGGSGIDDTLLRSATPGKGSASPRLFQVPSAPHPYQQDQLLIKLWDRVTTRSNVFAVWVTVGFFEVQGAAARPVKLGAEIGRAEGRHVRHRMFAIVDRSVLTFNPGPQRAFDLRSPSPGTGPPQGPPAARVVPYFRVVE